MRRASSAAVPDVLLVGQGPPAAGGIPTFISQLLADDWLRRRVAFAHVNTTDAGEKRPGALSPSNVRLTITHALAVFRSARHADIVHLNLAPVPALPLLRAIVLSTAAKMAGSRVVLHAHTGRLQMSLRSPGLRLFLRLAMAIVDLFVAVSKSAEGAARRCGTNVIALENGVDLTRFTPGPKEGNPPVLAFVGTVCERKGLLDLRDALTLLDDGKREGSRLAPRVLIAGDGAQEGPGAFERVRAAYERSGLTNVEFLGRLDSGEIVSLLAQADMFCLPSHWEGFPMSLLEAMASGCAPIASDVGDIPFMLDRGTAGLLIAPGDTAGLASAIDRLMRDRVERGRLGQLARERVERCYTVGQMTRNLYDVYLRVLGRDPQPGHSR